jgi:hypothetical protein
MQVAKTATPPGDFSGAFCKANLDSQLGKQFERQAIRITGSFVEDKEDDF